MRQINRLRPLQMRVARNDHFPLPLAQPHQRALQAAGSPPAAPRSVPAAKAAYPAPPGRCASGRCAAWPPPAPAASAPPRCSCGHLPAPACHWNLPASISFAMASSPLIIARSSRCVRKPAFRSIVAWAIDPAMSCRQSRRSKEMDSVNCATAAAGPPANRPLRETGVVFFMRFARLECATKRRGSHCQKKHCPRRSCVKSWALEAMSEFKFACPVCGQHITADSSTSGGQIECPTCFQKIVVPQAPGVQDTKFILSATQVAKPRPTSADAASQLGPLQPLSSPHLLAGCRRVARPPVRGRRSAFRLPRPDLQILPRAGAGRHQRPPVAASRLRCRSTPPILSRRT